MHRGILLHALGAPIFGSVAVKVNSSCKVPFQCYLHREILSRKWILAAPNPENTLGHS